MKLIWITNILFGHHLEMVGKTPNTSGSGSWLYAAYDASKGRNDVHLYIITLSDIKELMKHEVDGNTFYILPRKFSSSAWAELISSIAPDAVIVWGTESKFAYEAMKAMGEIPKVIYMQGVVNSIYEHYYDGLPQKYKNITVRDITDKFFKRSRYIHIQHQTGIETEMLKMATAVIVENDWCEDVCRSINPNLKVYRNFLPIKKEFYEYIWNPDNIEPYSIFTNAGGYSIKGHHILLQALGLVKKSMPNIRCYIPGVKLSDMDSIKRETGYIRFLKKIIRKYNLQENIVFVGSLSSKDMADYISRCNLYVMPSVMENHSSSLIEAMIVGAPSVSSLVGGTANLIEHGKNGLLYNPTDVQALAGSIIRVLSHKDFAMQISGNALKIRQQRKSDFGNEIINICKSVLQ